VVAALAVRDAIFAARQQAGLTSDDLVLNLPLTPERTRLACGDLQLAHTSRLIQLATEEEGKDSEKKKGEE